MFGLFEFSMQTVWIILLVFCILLEMGTVGLISIWFCAGSLIALILSFLGFHPGVQITAFLFSSVLLLIFTRPLVQKTFNMKSEATNADRAIGMEGIVKETIDNLKPSGIVRLDGGDWTARSSSDEVIEKGEKVTILRIEGVKVIVERLKEAPEPPSEPEKEQSAEPEKEDNKTQEAE